jgi:hypothetical protein
VRLSDLSDSTADAVRSAGALLTDLTTPSLRLGVTGFARSGKTVFITALVRNPQLPGGRLPFSAPMAQARIHRAYLEPQPNDEVPRFAYEEHLSQLAQDPTAVAAQHPAAQPIAASASSTHPPGHCGAGWVSVGSTSTSSTIRANG